MATKAQEAKTKKNSRHPKHAVRLKHRCEICGRARSYHRYFSLCRICLRREAMAGNIPGLKKSSW